jgi:hypothetical protein
MRQFGLIFAVLGFAAGCSSKASPYDRLCAIYKDYESVSNDDMLKMTEISERVERDIPEIMPAYNVIAQNGLETRYSVFVDLARQDGRVPRNWECETLRKRWPTRPR